MKNEFEMTMLENSSTAPVAENEGLSTGVAMEGVDTSEHRIDKLRNDYSYNVVNEAIDYLGKVANRAIRLQETIENSAVANHEQAFKYSKARVSEAMDHKHKLVGQASDIARESMLAPVVAINKVVDDFELKLGNARIETYTMHEKFSTDISGLVLDMNAIRQEYEKLASDEESIRNQILTEVDIANEHYALLGEKNEEKENAEIDRIDRSSKIDEVSKEIARTKRRIDNNRELVDEAEKQTLAELRSTRKKLNAANTVQGEYIAGLSLDIEEIEEKIIASAKRGDKLRVENMKIRDKAKELISRAEELFSQLEKAERSTIDSIGRIAIADVPDIFGDQSVVLSAIRSSPGIVLNSIRRSHPEDLGVAAASDEIASRKVIEALAPDQIASSLSADEDKLNAVLNNLVDNDESGVNDNEIIRRIMFKNGMPLPSGVDTVELFKKFMEKTRNDRELLPKSLSGKGVVRIKER